MARLYKLKIGLPDVNRPGRKVWLHAGFATEMDDTGTILCTLSLVPVDGWDGEFKLFPKEQEDEKKSKDC